MAYRKGRMVEIANGIYVPTRVQESLLDQYLRKQQECSHKSRDPRGMCYECGHRTEDPFKGFGGEV